MSDGRDLFLFPHVGAEGPCQGGWASVLPADPGAAPPYRCGGCGQLLDREDPAVRGPGPGAIAPAGPGTGAEEHEESEVDEERAYQRERAEHKAAAAAAGAVCKCGAPAERILGPGARGPCTDYPNCGLYPIEVPPAHGPAAPGTAEGAATEDTLEADLRALAHQVLQAGVEPHQLAMAAAIHDAPAGTVPVLVLACDIHQAARSGPLSLARFRPDTPRNAVPRTLHCSAQDLLARYDSAACPTRLASRCLVLVRLYLEGELVFDLSAVVWLGTDGPPQAQA